MFSIGKNRILNPLGICAQSQIFGFRKNPEYLYRIYRIFDVLPRQTTYEMETPSRTSLNSAIVS